MFGGDPFADPFGHMRRQMADMDRMMDPFGGMMNQMNQMNSMMNHMLGSTFGRQPMLGFDPMMQQHPPPPRSNGNRYRDPMAMDLFDGFGGFGFGGGLMRVMDHAGNDPNSMIFSQSTMITMNPDGTQRVISNSTRKAGDVKETRHAVRDGENERVAVGHHIGDRTHYIEKKRDKDGRFRQSHKFVNLDHGEADQFNQEFKSRANRNISGMFSGGHHDTGTRAIENGGGPSRSSHRPSATRPSEPRQSGSAAPIITIPDDEDDDIIEETPSRPKHTYNPYLRTGPTIREVSDEEAEATERNKRRKGTLGKFFNGSEH